MFSWYRELNQKETRTFWGCFAGWALDGADSQLYSFLIPTLIAVWGISTADAGLMGTVALISSAVGGWITGILCDRYGRMRMLQITIIWFSFFTALSGFAQNYEQLLIIRCLQGLGFGGEWTAGSVLLGEVVRAQYRGRVVGTVQSAFSVGWAIATTISSIVLYLLPPEIAWRCVFFVGVLPAGVVLYVRRNMTESDLFLAGKASEEAASPAGFLEIFSPRFLRTTILASLLAMGIQGSSYSITTWLPTFLNRAYGLSSLAAGGYVLIVTLGAFCGYLTSAHIADYLGRRKNFLGYAMGSILLVFAFMYIPQTYQTVMVLAFPLGFFTQGIYACIGPFMTELFPTELRGTGQGFCYNVGRGIGALLPFLVGYTAGFVPLGTSIAIFAIGAYLIAIIATLLLPETRGKVLEGATVVH